MLVRSLAAMALIGAGLLCLAQATIVWPESSLFVLVLALALLLLFVALLRQTVAELENLKRKYHELPYRDYRNRDGH